MNLTKPTDAQLPSNILDLVKAVDPLLAQYGLTGHKARVGLVLDWSGSMDDLYRSGQVQTLVERFVALGHRFDDDGQIDLYAYHTGSAIIGQLSAMDCADVAGRIRQVMGSMGGTCYSAGIKAFRKEAFLSSDARRTTYQDTMPYYLGFITDGENSPSDRTACMEQFRSSSYEPVFIQCIALGAEYDPTATASKPTGMLGRMFGGGNTPTPPTQFKFLAELDSSVPDRYMDNTSFFATQSPRALSDAEFFRRMMAEYPEWLKKAQERGLIKQ